MPSPSTTVTDVLPRDASSISALIKPLEALGFWAAVALPFLYVPLLVTGITERASQVAALVLIALHVAALVVGRHHYADD
jgi:hypothetical protein